MNLTRSLPLILALLLVPELPCSAGAAEQSDTIRIGVYLPLTGPMAAQGQAEYAGIRAAHRMKPDVLGTKVELFPADTTAEHAGTLRAATRLIKEHTAHALIGEPSGDDPFGGISIAEEAEKPTIIPFIQSPATKNKRYAFYTGLTNILQGEAAVRYAYSRLKAEKEPFS